MGRDACLHAESTDTIMDVTDRVTPEVRSKIMASVGSKDTTPELAVRRLLYSMGYRYRVHQRDLPGKPDLVFRSRHAAIFVHGCFWHGHGCAIGQLPKSRLDYWAPKIEENRERDNRSLRRLRAQGWRTLVVWQCQAKNIDRLRSRAVRFLGPQIESFKSQKKI